MTPLPHDYSDNVSVQGFAQAFAKAKPKGIVLVAGDEAKLKETEAEIKKIDSKIEVLPVPTNLTKPDSVESLFKKVTEKFGTVDVLVNNAGTLKGQDTMAAVSAQDWWSDFVSPPPYSYTKVCISYLNRRIIGSQLSRHFPDDTRLLEASRKREEGHCHQHDFWRWGYRHSGVVELLLV